MRQKGIIGILVLVFVLVIAIAGGAYYLGRVSTKLQPTKTQQPSQIISSPDPTTNWKTYINKEKNYSLRYLSEIFVQLICQDEEKTNFYLSERGDWHSDEFKIQDSVNMSTCARDDNYDIEITTPSFLLDPTEYDYYPYYSVESKDISVGGVPAKMYVYNPIKEIPGAEGLRPPWGIEVRLAHDGVNYLFSLSDEKWTNIFGMILATVKFTSE